MLVDRDRPVPASWSSSCASWPPGRRTTSAPGRGDSRSPRARVGPGWATPSPTRWSCTATRPRRWPRPAASTCARPPRWWWAPRRATRPTAHRREPRRGRRRRAEHAARRPPRTGWPRYWGSCPKGANDVVAELCGFEPGTHVAAIIYLGWATEHVTAPDRPPVQPPRHLTHCAWFLGGIPPKPASGCAGPRFPGIAAASVAWLPLPRKFSLTRRDRPCAASAMSDTRRYLSGSLALEAEWVGPRRNVHVTRLRMEGFVHPRGARNPPSGDRRPSARPNTACSVLRWWSKRFRSTRAARWSRSRAAGPRWPAVRRRRRGVRRRPEWAR